MDARKILIEREMSKSGLRAKVTAKCIECIYDPDVGEGTWRQQVAECSSICCPLYPVRPMPIALVKKAKT